MKQARVKINHPLVMEVFRARSLSGACTSVVAALICFCFKAWFFAVIACIVALIVLSTFLFSSRDTFERIITGFFFFSLLLVVVGGSAFAYLDLGLAFTDDGSRVTRYQDALYFSIITWTTVGYGDIKPLPSARLWAAGEAIYASLYMALLVAYVLKLLVMFRVYEAQFLEAKGKEPNTAAPAD